MAIIDRWDHEDKHFAVSCRGTDVLIKAKTEASALRKARWLLKCGSDAKLSALGLSPDQASECEAHGMEYLEELKEGQ